MLVGNQGDRGSDEEGGEWFPGEAERGGAVEVGNHREEAEFYIEAAIS